MSTQNIRRIAVTGGPCGGKSTGLVRIREHLSKLGYRVIIVPEVARMIFQNAGLPDFSNVGERLRYQRTILKTQLALEDEMSELAAEEGTTIMLTDRGALDGKAYLRSEDWQSLMDDLSLDEFQLLNRRYDLVLHLVTAAKGAPHAYACDQERLEPPARAIELDTALQLAYCGHGHHKIIDNSTNFEQKIRRGVSEISRFLGVPEPLEIERKFLVQGHVSLPRDVSSSLIEQIYLIAPAGGSERRVRKRSQKGSAVYTLCEKTEVAPGKRIEKEKSITGAEYLRLSGKECDPSRHPIRKIRHCFIHDNRCYELDEYLGALCGKWVLEVEVEDLQHPVNIPEWMPPVVEVTGNSIYGNASLASNGSPPEWRGEMILAN